MQREAFDVVIVGSGMAGGVAAQRFCEAGLRVLVVEAGGVATAPGVAHGKRFSGKTPIIRLSDYQIQGPCYASNANTRVYLTDKTGVDAALWPSLAWSFAWLPAKDLPRICADDRG